MPAVTSPVKATDAGDESNLEQVCKAFISYFSYDFLKPIDISFREKLCGILTPILISNGVHNRTISIRHLILMVLYKTLKVQFCSFHFNNGVCNA